MPEQSISLGSGEHVCHFFEGFADQKAVVLPFFREGLENDEHCIFITSEQSVDEWIEEFRTFGVDVEQETSRGALLILPKDSWRQPGDFNAIVKAREALGMFDELLPRFTGIRIAGDAAWAQNPDLPVEQLCHWEATANLVYEGLPIRAICQYKLSGHSPQAMHTALRTHPTVLLDGRCLPNDYFEGARILRNEPNDFGSTANAADVDEMLARLRSIA